MSAAAPGILILAAGAAARMRGTDKLLLAVDGVPLIVRQARAALATGCPVVVTLPPAAAARRAALAGLPVQTVEVAEAAEGMGASLRAGVSALPAGTTAVLVLLADLPEIEAGDLARLLSAHAAWPGAILRGTAEDGRPGHPVLFPAAFLPALRLVAGDAGARELLAAHAGQVRPVPLPGARAVTDLDTPEAWAEWRARTGR
ncbi:MAG: nucleotidyltransferase family protein [Rhodobacteraceae bacterium]|nr:nucleotidyltransferase family protein [Paracoccaceae bacterium]